MRYDIDKIPFSRYGSYFAISRDGASDQIFLRDLHGGDEAPSNLYCLEIENHMPKDIRQSRTETELCFESRKKEGLSVRIVLGKNQTVHIKAVGLAYRLAATGGKYDTLVPLSERQCEHHLYKKQIKVMFTLITGSLRISQEWAVVGSKNARIFCTPSKTEDDDDYSSNCSYLVIESYKTVWKKKKYLTYEAVREKNRQEYEAWEQSFPNEAGSFEESRKLACYLTWANFVGKEGFLTHDAMYMSKNWMYNIWSWDNCFGAIALSASHPELAYGQLKIFFDNQDISGVYPDYVNDAFASFNCAKPPVFAWAYEKMRKNNRYFDREEIKQEVFESLGRVTAYWFKYRSNQGAKFPVYYHGNDSGWDNASVFHQGFPVESPDLAAFLIYQMDVLGKLADELGNNEEAKWYRTQADHHYEAFIRRFYQNGRFYAYHVPSGERITEGESLLMYLPLIIAYRMTEDIRLSLIEGLKTRFETPCGLATEAPGSPSYKKGGYWLGPIWAPTSYLMIDALNSCGREKMAKRLAQKFCCVTNTGLMSENYDPFTGEGYDDPAFSWPSCVLLQLLYEMKVSEE